MKERFAAAPGPIAPTHPARQGLPDQACSAVQEPEPSAAALQGPREHAVLQGLRERTARQGPPERTAVQAAAPRAGEALPGEEAAEGT